MHKHEEKMEKLFILSFQLISSVGNVLVRNTEKEETTCRLNKLIRWENRK